MEQDYGNGVREQLGKQIINGGGVMVMSDSRAKKRGRRPKNCPVVVEVDSQQKRFFVDLSCDEAQRLRVIELLQEANRKDQGREISFRDIALFGVSMITDSDIPKIQELCLSKREKLQRLVDAHNLKHNTALSFEDYFLMRAEVN